MFANLEYTALFKEAATRHKEIRHTEKDCHFVKLVLSADPVQKAVGWSGFFNKLKTSLKPGLTLIAVSYEADYEDAGDERTLTHRHGSFIILEKVKRSNDEDRDEVLDRTERVAHDVMGFVLKAFRSPEARRQGRMIDRSNMLLDSIGPVADNHYGSQFSFKFTQPATQALAFNSDAFNLD
ncbi:hypothetical protein [Hymenobacter sp. BT491]|uniref:hypothetical protein n=1 Tax=Hymenobacter sp. BT491 TaxID=2766779 RepID=UPI001653A64A|nr:hypothetical protein [Hymenobacter sp. BT491]MBC6988574.1 hypothetical protein [Hymenobacter sp. BT491]